jgi:hypothetical protein
MYVDIERVVPTPPSGGEARSADTVASLARAGSTIVTLVTLRNSGTTEETTGYYLRRPCEITY